MSRNQTIDQLKEIQRARRDVADRLSPDVVLAVVEALEISERYLFSTPLDGALVAHAKVETALQLLNRPKP